MIATFLFSKGAPHEREVDHLIGELGVLKVDAKKIEAESAEGQHISQLYDLLGRPAVILTRDSGEVVERWQGSLPPAGDISYLAHS